MNTRPRRRSGKLSKSEKDYMRHFLTCLGLFMALTLPCLGLCVYADRLAGR